jgi:outer membrane autotransporter protein
MERHGFSAGTGPITHLRENFLSGTSRFALRSFAIGVVAFAGSALLGSSGAQAACVLTGVIVTCGTTVTTDTTFAANPATDRNYPGNSASQFQLNTDAGSTVSGFGLAVSNAGTGGVAVNNGGTISVNVGNTPSAGGTAALSITAAGGPISYTGGAIINNGAGNAFDVQQNGAGTTTIDVTGAVTAAAGEGIHVRDTAAGGNISVTTGAVTALTAGQDAIDVQSQSTTASVTIVANGNIQAGNAGIVGAIFPAGGTGNISVTANGAIDARFGVDAENFGTGKTTVTTVGPVTATSGNGIFALTTGGNVSVTTGAVSSTGNTAIVAQQTAVAGAGTIDVTTGGAVTGTTGIDAHNFGTGTVSVIANSTVTGTAAEGIKAIGNAGVTVQVANTVTGATNGLSLIGGTGGAGNISVTGAGGFVGGTSDAVNIKNNGSGSVTYNVSGATSSTGGQGITVRDTAVGGNISVTTGAVTALTVGKDAIDVQSQSTIANVTIVANGNIKAGNAGIVGALLNAAGTGDIDVTANQAIDARFGVDAENFGSGKTTVKTVGPVTATTGNGIFALTTGGDVSVTTGAVSSTGNTAIVAQQTKVVGGGNVGVTTNGAISGTTGIDAHNFGTGTVSVIANSTVTGTAAEGIKATGNAGVTVQVANTVTGATNGLALIGGTGGAGNISVMGAGGFVGGTSDAVNILNNGSGTVTYNVSGATSSTGGEGIKVRDTAVGGNISVTTGAVTALTAGKDAIDVQAQSLTGNVTIVANGNIKAGNAGIVGAILTAGAIGNIDVTANQAIDARFGVDAENFGSGNTTVKTVGPVTATSGNGIFALTTGGNVSVTTGAVTATSNTAIIAQQTKVVGAGTVGVTTNGAVSGTTGIDAHNFGTGAVNVTANSTVAGTVAEGIIATGNSGVTVQIANTVTGATRGMTLVGGTGGAGNISVTGAGGFVGGTGDAANILNNGLGTVTYNVSGATSSTGGQGITVRDTAVGGNIAVTTGAVTALTAGKDAIDVQSQSLTANVTIVANGNIKAGNAGIVGAIFPAAGTGNIDLTANQAIDARFGVDAENFGTGKTTVKTVGPVTATSGNGIFALTTGGNVSVTTGAVSSTSNTAIIAQQTNAAGAGTVDVTTNGAVSGTIGIDARNFGTAVTTVTANSSVAGTAGEGIKATGGGVVNVNVAGTVSGVTRGVTVVGTSGTITNTSSGTIRNSSGLTTDSALMATGGPFVLANAGLITGTVTFGAAADQFNNTGTWRTGGGTSDFGGGGDRLTNGPTGTVDAAGVGGIATTNFTNLALFVNQGRLTMVNGFAGDVLNTSGNADLGGVYAIDVSGANQSDKFVSTGTTTLSSGSTVEVHHTGNLQVGAHYTIVTAAGGRIGTFGSVTGGTAFLAFDDTYDANNVYLDVFKFRNFADAGLTRNQISTGRGLDSIPMVGPLFDAVANLPTDAQARMAFDQLSGEAHASMTSVLVDDSRFVRSSAIDRLRSSFGSVGAAPTPVMSYAPGGPVMVAPTTDRFVVWGQAFGAWGNVNGDGNAASVRRSSGGLTFGADALVFDTWRVGLLGGYSNTSISINGRNSSGKSENYHIGAYAGSQWGNLALRTGVAYTWHDISTSRFVAFPGFTDSLTASYGARTTQVFGDLGYRINMNSVAIEPFGNLAYVNLQTDGFREIGGPAALTSRAVSTGVTFTTLGLRASSDFMVGGTMATIRGSLGWRHAFGDVTPMSTFAFAGGTAFGIAGVPIAQNAAVVEAGFDMRLFQNASFGIAYNAQFASAARDQSVKANLAVKF